MSKYNYNKSYFKNIHTENQAYWLGFLYADGCITRFYRNEKLKSMSLEITLQSNDISHLEKFKKDLECDVPIRHKIVSGKYHADKLVINSTSMCRDLINLGCTPCKSLTLSFPDTSILPLKFIPDFIRGYFDGDGGVSYTEGNAYFKSRNKKYKQHHYRCYFTGNQNFISEIRKVLISNNINVSDVTKDTRSNACSIYVYGKENIGMLKNYLYRKNCVCLSRKLDKFFYIQNDNSLHINRAM